MTIEQSDREAAADLLEELTGGKSGTSVKMRRGEADDYCEVQAFATARLKERERCAKVADDEYDAMLRAREHAVREGSEVARDRIDARARTASRIAQAIRGNDHG